MVAYVVFIRERVRDKEAFATYSGLSGPTLAGHDVKVLAAYGKNETLEGPPIEGAVMLEFPTIQAAKAWYDGEGYRDAREHRFKGADYRVFITGGL